MELKYQWLDKKEVFKSYQSEAQLERKMIEKLEKQRYERVELNV